MRYLLLGLLLSCVGAGIVVAASAGNDTHRVVIRLISKNSVVSVVDKVPKKKFSRGDRIVTQSTLRNQVAQFGKPKGALVGRDWATSVALSATSYKTSGYAVLPGGRILFAGRLRNPGNPSVVNVTGGTGRFANARGTAWAKDVGGTTAINVYRLTLP